MECYFKEMILMVQKARYGFPPFTRYERLETLPIISLPRIPSLCRYLNILEIRVFTFMNSCRNSVEKELGCRDGWNLTLGGKEM